MKTLKIRLSTAILFCCFFYANAFAQNSSLIFNDDGAAAVVNLAPFDGITNQPFTIEAWVKTSQTGRDAAIWSIGNETGRSLQLRQNALNQLELIDIEITSSDVVFTSSADNFNDGLWHHTIVIYDGTTIKLYLDALPLGEVTRNLALNGTFGIGQSTLGSPDRWIGELDEIRIWDFAFLNSQIFAGLFQVLGGFESGLLHYYDFDGISGTILNDRVGSNQQDAQLIGFTDPLPLVNSTAADLQTVIAAGDGAWNDPATWIGGNLPRPIDQVSIPTETSGPSVFVTEDASVFNLIVGSPGELASGSLLLSNANLQVNGFLTANRPSTITGTTGTELTLSGHNQTISIQQTNPLPALRILGTGNTSISSGSDEIHFAEGLEIGAESTLSAGITDFVMEFGDWLNNGTFDPGNAKVTFSGVVSTVQNGNFNNLTIEDTNVTFLTDVTIEDTFTTNENGSIDLGSNTFTAGTDWLFGNITSGFTFTTGANIVVNKVMNSFDPGGAIGIEIPYPSISIESGGRLPVESNVLNIADGNSILIAEGELLVSFAAMTLGNNSSININSGGALTVSAGFITMGAGSSVVNNGGDMSYLMNESPTVVMGTDYAIVQNSGTLTVDGGDLASFVDPVIFDGLGNSGFQINGGQVNRFRSVIFEGSGSTSSAYLQVNSNAFDNVTLDNVGFELGPINNVLKSAVSGTGNIVFTRAFGEFAGPDFHLVEPSAGNILWQAFQTTDDYALNFDDNNSDYVSIAGGVDFEGPITIEAWIRPTQLTSERSIFTWFNNPMEYVSFRVSDGFLEVFSQGAMSLSSTDTQPLTSNQWVHVAYTLDAANNYIFYINGQQTSTGTYFGDPLVNAGSTTIGSRSGTEEFFEGEIDDIRIWSSVRTPAEIANNAFTRFETPFPTDLETFYNFDEGSGTILNDLIVGARLGALNGFALTDPEQSNWVQAIDKPTKRQNTLNFNGIENHVLVSADLPDNYTMEAWIRPEDLAGDRVVFGWGNEANSEYARLFLADGIPSFEFNSMLVNGSVTIASPEPLPEDEWHHLAIVKSGSNRIELYVDGISRAVEVTTDINSMGAISELRIGALAQEGNLTQAFDGDIDEVRIWDGPVLESDIRAFAITEDLTGHPSDGILLAHYVFNEGAVPGGDNSGSLTLSIVGGTYPEGSLVNFPTTLTGNESNWVSSEAFEAINVGISGNGNIILSGNTPNLDDGTDLGVILVGDQLSSTIVLTNTGFNEITITAITANEVAFTASADDLVLAPFSTTDLNFVFDPIESIDANSEVDITYIGSNGITQTESFNLQAEAYPNEEGSGNAVQIIDGGELTLSPADPFALSVNDPFTIEMWVNLENLTTSHELFSNVGGASGTGIEFDERDGQLSLSLISNSSANEGFGLVEVGPDLRDLSWVHVAATYDGSGNENGILIYIDGESQPTSRRNSLTLVSGDEINTNTSAIVTLGESGVSLDEFRLYNRVLTAEEISNNRFFGTEPDNPSLISYYRFDDIGEGTLTTDLTGNSSGTLVGSSIPLDIESLAPINNTGLFNGLQDVGAVFAGVDLGTSGNLTIDNNGSFALREAIFANDNPTLNGFTDNSRISGLSPQVIDRLDRNWLVDLNTEEFTSGFNTINMGFGEINTDPNMTYYLLESTDNIEDYEVAAYAGYRITNDSVIFTVPLDSIGENSFYSVGRSMGFPGNALAFDGINDQVNVSNISHDETFTYEFWFSVANLPTNGFNLLTVESGDPVIRIGINTLGQIFTIVDNLAGQQELVLSQTTTPIVDGKWHHMAWVRDNTSNILYIDGVPDNSISSALSSPSVFGNMVIGDAGTPSVIIDELRIWDTVREPLEILENLDGVVESQQELITYFRFDQIVGENLPNLSVPTSLEALSLMGEELAGKLNNFNFDNVTSGWVPSAALLSATNQNALNFDGINDFVNITNTNLNLVNGDYSLQAWIKPSIGSNTSPGFKTIAAWNLSTGLVRLILNDGVPTFVMDDGASSLPISGTEALTEDTWHNIAITMEGTSASLYVDGRLQINILGGMNVNSPLTAFTIGANLEFGGMLPENLFDGDIDELSIWNRALTESDIRTNLFQEIDPLSPGLISYYNFNQGVPEGNNSGLSELLDAIDPLNNGAITNFSLTGTFSNFISSTVFESFVPELSIFLEDGTDVSIQTMFNLGTQFTDGDRDFTLILANTGLDTIDIASIASTPNLMETRFLMDERLFPFESDTISFQLDAINEGSNNLGVSISTDELPVASNTFLITGYPNLPGAGNSFVSDGTQSASSSVESNTILNNTSFSIEYWALRNENTDPNYAFGHGTGPSTTNEQLHVGFRAGDVVTFSFFGNDLNFDWSEANNEWNHFAFTYEHDEVNNNGIRRIYINGIEVALDAAPVAPFTGGGSFFVGQAEFGQPFNGELDEMRIWNVPLDEATIRRNLARKLDNDNLPLDNLIAYYRFDDTDIVTDIADIAGNFPLTNNGANSTLSSAPFGDLSLYTYTDSFVSTGSIGEPVRIENIADPTLGVHLYRIEDDGAPNFSSGEFENIFSGFFGVFAPNGNTFDFRVDLSAMSSSNDSSRIVTQRNITLPDWEGASDLYGFDPLVDSITAFNRTSGLFSLGELQYPLNIAANDPGLALNMGAIGNLPIESPNDSYGDFTIEYWMISSTTTGQETFFNHSLGVTSRVISTGLNDGRLFFLFRNEVGAPTPIVGNVSGSTLVADGEWHHVAFVRNGTTASVYIDGELDNTATGIAAGNLIAEADATSFIDNAETSQIDEFRLWNTALTEEELRGHTLTNDLTNHPQRDAIAAYYRFDDDIALGRIVDLIGYANGTLNENADLVISGAFALEDGVVISLADNGPGSLRDMIEQANANPGIDTIRFNLPGTGPWTINLTTELLVTDSLVIEGESQNDFDFENSIMVEINGGGTTDFGLHYQTDYFELYGLQLSNFSSAAVRLNFVGLDGYRIGEELRGNVFTNNEIGIEVIGATNGLISSNLIGTFPDGTIGTNQSGITINGAATGNIIGGSATSANVIANNVSGVVVEGALAFGNQIRQNQIFCNSLIGINQLLDGNNAILRPAVVTITSDEITGTGVEGQEIDIYLANDVCDDNQGSSYLGTVTVAAGDTWSLAGLAMSEGDFVTATANTLTDGTSEFSDAVRLNVNPVVTISDLLTNLPSPELSGTIDDPEASIAVNIDAEPAISANNNGDGTWTLAAGLITPLLEGTFSANVTATDSLGNEGTSSSILTINLSSMVIGLDPTSITPTEFIANWELIPGINEYELDVALDDQFTQFVAGFESLLVTGDFANVTGLEYGTTYFYRVRGLFSNGTATGSSEVISLETTTATGTVNDGIALRRIFDEMNGVNWDRQVGWTDINARIETYQGVVVTGGRVVSIDLSSNNLNGTLPNLVGEELSQLTTFLLNGNQITDLSDLSSLTSLVDLQVQDNLLDFSSLELNVGINGIVYAPQGILLEPQNLIENEGNTVALNRVIGGTSNVYSWRKNGLEIAGVTSGILSFEEVSFDDEGTYLASVTNQSVPGLTIATEAITIRISSLETDSIALRTIYDEMDGPNWIRGQNWTSEPIAQWDGVTITNNRVTGVDLSSNMVSGDLSAAVLDLINLEVLDLSDNLIQDIPSLSSLGLLTSVNISDNQIGFDGLEANIDLGDILMIGTQTLGVGRQDLEVRAQEPFTVSVEIGGENNLYQWSLNGNIIEGAVLPTFEITNVNRVSQGLYECRITNSLVNGVEILSDGQDIMGIANVLGIATIAGSDGEFLSNGSVRLLAIRENAYDTIGGVLRLSTDGSYQFSDVPLQDYILSIDPDNRDEFLPTYHVQSIQWDFATVLALDSDTTGIDVMVERIPEDIELGVGTFVGEIFTDFPDDGRLEARRRVRRVGCALRRRRSQGRGQSGFSGGRVEMDSDGFELYSYQTSNENGEFVFNNLPEGDYRIFIEYPGIPINEDSFTEFSIGANPNEDDIAVVVTVFEDGIDIIEQNVVSVDDNSLFVDFDIFPNPADEELFVNSAIQGRIQIEVLDLNGVTVLSTEFENRTGQENNRLRLSNVKSGIYLLRITPKEQGENSIMIKKLIIRR